LESEEAKAFAKVAQAVDLSFGVTSEQALFDELALTGDKAVVLFKKFDEGKLIN